MARWAQGLYQPKHPDKYIGKKTPRYRSSWEWAFMNFCDNNPSIRQEHNIRSGFFYCLQQ